MKTDIIKSFEDLDGFADEPTKTYVFTSNIEIKCSLKLPTDWSIKAGGYIKASGYIEAGWYIEAGGYIEAGWYILSLTFNIACTRLSTKLLPFWRNFWANMSPLSKWRNEILDENNCWDNLKRIPTKNEAMEICGWDGWHPILRVQLEMFFGLKKSTTIFKP